MIRRLQRLHECRLRHKHCFLLLLPFFFILRELKTHQSRGTRVQFQFLLFHFFSLSLKCNRERFFDQPNVYIGHQSHFRDEMSVHPFPFPLLEALDIHIHTDGEVDVGRRSSIKPIPVFPLPKSQSIHRTTIQYPILAFIPIISTPFSTSKWNPLHNSQHSSTHRQNSLYKFLF